MTASSAKAALDRQGYGLRDVRSWPARPAAAVNVARHRGVTAMAAPSAWPCWNPAWRRVGRSVRPSWPRGCTCEGDGRRGGDVDAARHGRACGTCARTLLVEWRAIAIPACPFCMQVALVARSLPAWRKRKQQDKLGRFSHGWRAAQGGIDALSVARSRGLQPQDGDLTGKHLSSDGR